jgi:hypothetical protein
MHRKIVPNANPLDEYTEPVNVIRRALVADD